MPRQTPTARQRELFRYFQPPSVTFVDSEKAVIHSSNDLSLTAFAQLGALRLNAKRGIISLVGRDTEYVIAEAGRTLSLQDDTRHDKGDELWHGVGALQSKTAVGLTVIDLLAGISQDAIPHLVVDDLQKDERFSNLPIVTEEPFARFLACFPLQTQAGYVIGLYTIVDDRPREISESELQFLRDMARTAMDHIESGRVKQQHHRAERMVKALGLFLEGGESLRNWWINQGREGRSVQQIGINENIRRGFSYSQQADQEFGVRDLPDTYSSSFGLNSPKNMPPNSQVSHRISQSLTGDGRPPMPRSTSNSTGSGTEPLSTYGSGFTLQVDQDSVTSDGPSTSTGRARRDFALGTPQNTDLLNQNSMSGKRLQEALLTNELKRTFARASNLIREAIDACGVAFFDASIGSFGTGSERINMNAKAPGVLNVDGKADTTTSGSEEEKRRTSDTDGSDKGPSALPSETYVGILGYSTRTRSSVNKHSVPDAHELFPESLLRQLAKKYPHGKIFNFDEDGTMSSSDADKIGHPESQITSHLGITPDEASNRRKKKKKLSREEESAGILSVVPNARTVAWFPLWDSMLERWYAGTLIWSKSATRVFTPEEDLTYMATFGNSIMAEVSRLSALVASQMKVDFISSISHELRSPLHGILACAEFLKDDQGLTDVSEEMVSTINNCGQTLLQTIDHVLDFAKITKKVKEKSARSRTTRRPKEAHRTGRRDMSNGRPMDLRILTEEVIDSVYAGRRSWKPDTVTNLSDASEQASYPAPIIIVDVSWRENWIFDMDDGAWRRILMNLFSNAVKYTKRGYVRVALSMEHDEIPGKRRPYPRLCLDVSDSGQGISQEFLKNHVYTAFKQEDALAVGTGLGLSIVRQIILDLGGTIDIKSEVGAGTQAHVSIPLLPNKLKASKEEDVVAEVRKNIAGTKACLVNSAFDQLPAMSDAPTGIMSPEAEALMILKSSVRLTLAEWFGMDVITSPQLDLASADVHITISTETVDEEIYAAKLNPSGATPPMVIVICNPLSRKSNYVTESGVQVFYLQQPISPHNFAAALSHAVHQTATSPHDASIAPIEIQNSSPESSGNLPETHPPAKTFEISLPTPKPKSPSWTVRSPATEQGSYFAANMADESRPRRFLLVEDNEINLSLLVRCISKLGYPFVTATNGLEAVEAFKSKGPFDVVIIDIQMPIMNGFAATREIRTLERKGEDFMRHEKPEEGRTRSTKAPRATVIALTGASSLIVKQEAFAVGVDLFLLKPASMKSLRDIIAGLDGGVDIVAKEGV